jgi:hypothetical protein
MSIGDPVQDLAGYDRIVVPWHAHHLLSAGACFKQPETAHQQN